MGPSLSPCVVHVVCGLTWGQRSQASPGGEGYKRKHGHGAVLAPSAVSLK